MMRVFCALGPLMRDAHASRCLDNFAIDHDRSRTCVVSCPSVNRYSDLVRTSLCRNIYTDGDGHIFGP